MGAHTAKNFLQRLYPYPMHQLLTREQWQQNQVLFRRWKTVTIAMALGFLLGLPVLYGFVLAQIQALIIQATLPQDALFFPVEWAAFCVPGFFLGLATLGRVIEYIQRRFLGGRYLLFEDYYNADQGYNNREAERGAVRFIWPLAVITLFLFCSARLVLYPDRLLVKDIFKLKKQEYPLTAFTQMRYARNYLNPKTGVSVPVDVTELVLSDGSVIRTGNFLRTGEKEVFRNAFTQRSGLKTDTADWTTP